MVDTAGTPGPERRSPDQARGASRVLACATHAVLSGQAVEKIEASPIEQLIVSNTIPLNDTSQGCAKIVTLSVAELFGEAIRQDQRAELRELFVRLRRTHP